MFRNMQNAEIIRKMTEEFDEVSSRFTVLQKLLLFRSPGVSAIFWACKRYYFLIRL